MPNFPIRKKYPTIDKMTFCSATATPAVSNPAKVTTDPSLLAKAKATIIATANHRVNFRSNRNWYLRRGSRM